MRKTPKYRNIERLLRKLESHNWVMLNLVVNNETIVLTGKSSEDRVAEVLKLAIKYPQFKLFVEHDPWLCWVKMDMPNNTDVFISAGANVTKFFLFGSL